MLNAKFRFAGQDWLWVQFLIAFVVILSAIQMTMVAKRTDHTSGTAASALRFLIAAGCCDLPLLYVVAAHLLVSVPFCAPSCFVAPWLIEWLCVTHRVGDSGPDSADVLRAGNDLQTRLSRTCWILCAFKLFDEFLLSGFS